MNRKKQVTPTTIFTDIGGVMLTNGWDRNGRIKAIRKFKLDPVETEERHHLTFDTYESGKISLDEYLKRLVFYKKRNFSEPDFRKFMFEQSRPFPDMLKLIRGIKEKYGIKIAVVSNEGRELNNYRIQTFGLNEFVDFFISSSFVHFRKPDADIFKVALDIAQVSPEKVIYIEDRPMFVQVADGLGIRGIIHKDYETTSKVLASFGWTL
ncbi:MAG: HAD family phosphatase [Bacteroidota bacterium]|nr:HAD family phosphatase [Bacteroidota bacterium]MDP4213336.1 HAD family phosphatase [Bacteroidota bacterium]MDP4251886.1 HAD family phosphatase [Bacteroidota bacterium]